MNNFVCFFAEKCEKLVILIKMPIFEARFLKTLEMETKSKTCIMLSSILLINSNWQILSPSPNKKVSHQVAFFYNVWSRS